MAGHEGESAGFAQFLPKYLFQPQVVFSTLASVISRTPATSEIMLSKVLPILLVLGATAAEQKKLVTTF